jgi:hypothetical protein
MDTNELQLNRNQCQDQRLWILSRYFGFLSTAAGTIKEDLINHIVGSFFDKISADQNPLSYFKETESFASIKGSEKYLALKDPIWNDVCNAMEEGIKEYYKNTYAHDNLKWAVENKWDEKKVNYLYTYLLGRSL